MSKNLKLGRIFEYLSTGIDQFWQKCHFVKPDSRIGGVSGPEHLGRRKLFNFKYLDNREA
jgi:hypothetical protein